MRICYFGHVSDSDYNKRYSYLRNQRLFHEKDFAKGKVAEFLNILDRGLKRNHAL